MKKLKFIADVAKVELPFIIVGIDATRNVAMLVDTGSTHNQLFGQAYEDLKDLFTSTGTQMNVHGILKEEVTDEVRGKIYICGVQYEAEFQLAPKETGIALSEFAGFPVSGIIGTIFMAKHGWIIDYSKQEIYITKMTQEELKITKGTKILIPAKDYELSSDNRLLIPFTNGDKIGFINKQKFIVVPAKYSMYYGECYLEDDYIIVLKPFPYGFYRKSGFVSSYLRPVYGIINADGKEVVPTEYFNITSVGNEKNIFMLTSKEGKKIKATIERNNVVFEDSF